MGKNNVKYTIEQVKGIIQNKGFALLSDDYVNSGSKLTLKDGEGYLYSTTLVNIHIKQRKPSKFHTTNKYSFDNIKTYLKLNFPNYILLSKEYIGLKTKMIVEDENGFKADFVPANVVNGFNVSFFSPDNSYTIENIHKWCEINNKSFKLISNQYINSKEKIKWECLACGEFFEAPWMELKLGSGCSFCVGVQVGVSNCLSTLFPKLAKEWDVHKNFGLTPYDVTSKSGKKVWWKCENNHEWETRIADRVSGCGCPYCAGRVATRDHNLLLDNPKLCKQWHYEKNYKLPNEYTPKSGEIVWWKCERCDREWQYSISGRNHSNVRCICNNLSKGEEKLSSFFNENKIDNIQQYKFQNCINIRQLPFDFYLSKYNVVIEYSGIQHYQPIEHFGGEKGFKKQQNRDQIKRDYCKENNIKLIEIPYWDFDNMEDILIKELGLEIKSAVNT